MMCDMHALPLYNSSRLASPLPLMPVVFPTLPRAMHTRKSAAGCRRNQHQPGGQQPGQPQHQRRWANHKHKHCGSVEAAGEWGIPDLQKTLLMALPALLAGPSTNISGPTNTNNTSTNVSPNMSNNSAQTGEGPVSTGSGTIGGIAPMQMAPNNMMGEWRGNINTDNAVCI